MSPIKILFISIEGNTRSFVKKLADYAAGMHDQDSQNPVVQLKEISEQTDFADESDPYFAFVPTYLDGGNGIDNGVKELMTNALGEYIGYAKKMRRCVTELSAAAIKISTNNIVSPPNDTHLNSTSRSSQITNYVELGGMLNGFTTCSSKVNIYKNETEIYVNFQSVILSVEPPTLG